MHALGKILCLNLEPRPPRLDAEFFGASATHNVAVSIIVIYNQLVISYVGTKKRFTVGVK